MRVLVVEDDKKIAAFVVKGLKQSGFAADHAADGEEGLFMAASVNYDAAIVDLMLPKLETVTLPPWASTTALTRLNPSPRPRCERLLSPR